MTFYPQYTHDAILNMPVGTFVALENEINYIRRIRIADAGRAASFVRHENPSRSADKLETGDDV